MLPLVSVSQFIVFPMVVSTTAMVEGGRGGGQRRPGLLGASAQ